MALISYKIVPEERWLTRRAIALVHAGAEGKQNPAGEGVVRVEEVAEKEE